MTDFVLQLVESLTPDTFINYLVDLVPWLVIIIPVHFAIGLILYKVIKPAQSVGLSKKYDDWDDWGWADENLDSFGSRRYDD